MDERLPPSRSSSSPPGDAPSGDAPSGDAPSGDAPPDAQDTPPARPDADVIDHLVSVAASRAQSRIAAPDDRAARRPARTSRRSSWTRRLQQTGVTLGLALVLAIGWWNAPAIPEAPQADASSFGVPLPERSSLNTGRAPLQQAALPAWDDTDDVVRLHRRIELVQARSASSDWMPVSATP